MLDHAVDLGAREHVVDELAHDRVGNRRLERAVEHPLELRRGEHRGGRRLGPAERELARLRAVACDAAARDQPQRKDDESPRRLARPKPDDDEPDREVALVHSLCFFSFRDAFMSAARTFASV